MGTEKGGRGKEPFTLIGEYSPQKLRGGLERQISSYLLYLLADLEDGGIFFAGPITETL